MNTILAKLLAAVPLVLAFHAAATDTLETAEAKLERLPRDYRLNGTVEAIHRSTVSAQTQGQVEEILFDVDDFVTKGSVILRLKDKEQQALLSQAEAALKETGARYQEALDEFKRIQGVYAKKLVSQADMDRASATLTASQARRDAAAAMLQQANEQLEYTRVRAPYSGIVTDRYVEVGEMANPGQKLISGISLDQLRVLVDVPQSLIPAIRANGKASVLQPGKGYVEATKLTIFPYAEHGSNTFKVRLDLPAGIEQLFPGMFVKTAFTIGAREELLIPAKAVIYRSEVTGVYVVGVDGRVTLRHIRLGRKGDNGKQAVLAGLNQGERVALDPVAAGSTLKQQQKAGQDDE